ncbi:ATP-binding protein [Sphaerisporangium album]|uniref:ATP-binding protein n=1 Tax=Sphaerisporangium album TaxID=509200 RepID=A0A367F879_9ACTN|nr:ATP-binding protein [Sphaerisporangium album]RCG25925.1 ATP-binding protein [Sphaerisporangium album]
MTAQPPQHQVSPEATGGAGTIEEYSLGAVALARLLTGDLLPGLSGPPVTVALQRRVAGNTLDDLVLRSGTDTAETGIDFQIKRTASPTASDSAFVDALGQCMETLRQQREALAAGRLQLGFGASGPRGPLEQLRRLTEIARSHATATTFLGVLVPGATAGDVRTRYGHVKGAVAEIIKVRGESLTDAQFDELTYELLKYLRVWIFEVGDDGRDVLETQSRLGTILPAGGPDAHAVFSELRTLAETWGPNAGVIDASMLRAALFARGIPLTADPRHQVELGRVLNASRQELGRTVDQMGGRLRLERATAAEALGEAIRGGGIVLVSGAAGVGKSVLARRAVQDLDETATVVAISLTTRSGDTLATVQQELGVSHLGTVLAAAPTTGPRVLLIDGAEHALTDAGRLLESLLEAAPTAGTNSPPWRVVITSRADAAGPLSERLGDQLTAHIELDELSNPEVDEVSGAFPALAPLLRHPRSKRLLRRPYLVDLMVRSQAAPQEGEALGEEDVLAVVHEKVVRRSEGLVPGQGSAHDRDVAWNTLAEAVIAGAGSSRLPGVDGAAVGGLISDDIFRRQRSTYRFAHDVLADYATAMRLGDDDGAALLESATAPRSLIRAVRLALQRRLAEAASDANEVRRAWDKALNLCRDLAARDGSRWEEVPFEALISMGSPDGVLAALTPDLLTNNGAGLGKLVDVTGRYATTSRREPNGDALELDDVLAAPVVMLLGTLGRDLPERLTYLATRLIQRWLVSVEVNERRPTAFIVDPTVLSAAAAAWAGDDWYGKRYEVVLAVVGLLGGHLSVEGRALLERAKERGHDLDVVVEDPEVAAALARDNPDLLLEIAGSYYLDLPMALDPAMPERRPARTRSGAGRRRGRTGLSGYEEEDGVREHSHRTSSRLGFGLAGPTWGPFAVLLDRSPQHGLRLVGAVVEAATDARLRVEASFGHPPDAVHLSLKLPHWDEAAEYDGPGTAWGWYRRLGSGAYVAMSALMALREWAKAQIQTRPLVAVLDDVLRAGSSLAFPAVAYSLLVSDLPAAGDLIDAFLEHPAVWDLEIGRVVGEGTMSYPTHDQASLRVTPDQIVFALVVTGDDERKAALKAVGERLLAASLEELGNPPDDDPRLLVPRRRALNFNSDSYEIAPSADHPGMIEISLGVPTAMQQELERGGGRAATLSLTQANYVLAAIKIRDGEATETDAAQLYAQMQEILQANADTPGADPIHSVDEAGAAAAAAVVVRAAAGNEKERVLLPEAVEVLTRIANETKPEPESYRSGRDMSWDMGADRSAATALPLVLLNDELLAASGALRATVATAVERLAESTSREVRYRLIGALQAAWSAPCDGDEDRQVNHGAAMAVYHEMLLGAGIGPWNGQERPRVRLTEPLDEALRQPELIFDLSAAADALPGLKTAATCDCEHGKAARSILASLVEHDSRTWPTKWARHHYHGSGVWRREVDSWVATQVLADDDVLLEQYLGAFSTVPEQLTGLLTSLAEQALTREQGERLFAIWPRLLACLLPGARHVSGPGEDRPNWRDAINLDKSLLPKRPAGARWPGQEWVAVLVRWTGAYAPRPSLSDRLIECLGSQGLAFSATGVELTLLMLGDDAAQILRDSRYAPHWLRLVLLERSDGLDAQRPALRQLLDGLAARGSADAISIQRELEA